MTNQQLWIPTDRRTHTDRRTPTDRRIPTDRPGHLEPGPDATGRREDRRGRRGGGVRPGPPGAGENHPVILVSGSPPLQDEVARVAAAAGLDLEIHGELAGALARQPEILLLGSDIAAGEPPARWLEARSHGPELILVGSEDTPGLWEDAARTEAGRVAVLPSASGWLAEYLSRRHAAAGGYVLGVMGGCGGAGASSLACWLAYEAARLGVDTLLVDGDPLGGGLDTVLGSRDAPGIRWPDLADVRGALNPVQLVSALPQVSGFSLLSQSVAPGAGERADAGGGIGPGAVQAVLSAARAGYGLTVVDCARAAPGDPLVPACDSLLLVVPGLPRPLLAAGSVRDRLGSTRTAAVIRGPLGDGLDDQRAADAAGLPLAGYLPAVKRLEHAGERGILLERGQGRRVKRVTRFLVEQLPLGRSAAEAFGVPAGVRR